MDTPLQTIKKKSTVLLEKSIFIVFGARLAIDQVALETPPDEKLGDFAFPCFALAKELKKSPIDIAQALAGSVTKLPSVFSSVCAVGPYVNFFLSPSSLADSILTAKKSSSKKKGGRIIVEYVSPNTNKPLHIGHARNAFLGDSIARMYEYCGAAVIRACLINDRGIHICKSMVAYQTQSNELKMKGQPLPTPQNTGKKGDHLVGDFYVLYNTILKKDPSIEERAKQCLQKWEAGDTATLALWKKMNGWVLKGLSQTFQRVGISFDVTYFESEIYKGGRDIILKGLKDGIFKQDESGAIYADLSSFNLPDKILLRKDGTSLYITQEIYLAMKKMKDYRPSTSLYVVMSEQDLYFKQFFAVLKLLKVPYADHCIHLSYGMVRLPEGRIKSREGTTADSDMLLDELQSLVEKEIIKRESTLAKVEIKKRAQSIAMAAFKYYLLVVGPKSDVIFNPKESIAIHGKTGPYILYTYARLKSILKKARSAQKTKSSRGAIYTFDSEKQLLVQLMNFTRVIEDATATANPSLVANYLHTLAQNTNDYYHRTPVLKAEGVAKNSRLLLIAAIADTLKSGLGLLGIKTIERM